jgi:outer membrane protein assembly factor BamB
MRLILKLLTTFVLGFFASNLHAALPIAGDPKWVALGADASLREQGWSVDISGDLAIVGAPFLFGGSAFVFDVNSGSLIHQLKPSDPISDALFGFSVAIDNDLAVISASQRNAAYVFDVTTGVQLNKLVPPQNGFNYPVRSVDISNGRAVLGVPLAQSSEPFSRDAGAAFVYDARGGNLLYQIDGPTNAFKREFGSTVAIEEHTLAVSSPSDAEQHDIKVYDARTGKLQWSFGYATTGRRLQVKEIAVDNELIVVGAGASVFDMPEALVLDRSSGALLNRINTRVQNLNDGYKNQLDVSCGRLFVGSWGTFYEDTGDYVGAVNVFDVSSGDYLGRIVNPSPIAGDYFGYSVAVDGNRLVVGSPGENMTYSFLIVPEPSIGSFLLILAVAAVPIRLRFAS